MAGRQRTGASAQIVANVYQARQEFQQRLQEAGIKAGIEAGLIEPKFQGGQFQGFGAPTTPQMTMQNFMSGQANNLSPYQLEPKFNKYGRVEGYNTTRLKPDEQINQALLQTGQRPASSFVTQQNQQQLNSSLPNTPFVPGPDGGFITGDNAEVAPGYGVPREQVMQSMLMSQGEAAKQQELDRLKGLGKLVTPDVPLIMAVPGQAPQVVGSMEKGGRVINAPNPVTEELNRYRTAELDQRMRGNAAGIGGAFRGTPINPQLLGSQPARPDVARRINDLRTQGMSDAEIARYLLEVGQDPSIYGLQGQ